MRRRRQADANAAEEKQQAEAQGPPEQRDDTFESKHVKEIIEAYENVMNIIEEEERALD